MSKQPIAVELEAINREGETQVVRDSGLTVQDWLITSCRSANNIMPITFFLPAFIASSFYSA